MIKKILAYLQSHFWLKNILLTICSILVFMLLINLALNIFTRHNQKHIVPDFTEMTLEQATKAAKKARLNLIVFDSLYTPKTIPGTVLDQNPKPKTGVKSRRKVFLTINSFKPKMEEIPYVTGFSLRQAKNRLESKGFEIDKLIYKQDMATNNIMSQSWKGKDIARDSKTKAELGSAITLVVGRNANAPMPIVPKVIGLSLREAKSRLWEIGFNIGEIRYDDGISRDDYSRARVYKQTPLQESRNNYGSTIALWLTLDNKKMANSSNAADEAARQEVEMVEDSTEVPEIQMLRELGID